MSLIYTEFGPQTVEPASGRCRFLYQNATGTPGSSSGPIAWTADDGGQVVDLTYGTGWMEVEPLAVGTCHLTATGYENGQTVTSTVTVDVVVDTAGRLAIANVVGPDVWFTLVDAGTVTVPGDSRYDGGAPTAGAYLITIDGGHP